MTFVFRIPRFHRDREEVDKTERISEGNPLEEGSNKKLPEIPYPGSSAGMTGFEPAISGLTGQRVRPLHYTPKRPEVYHVVGSDVKTSDFLM